MSETDEAATTNVQVVAMPTRKRLRLHVVEGPRLENTFEWKRDLLLALLG